MESDFLNKEMQYFGGKLFIAAVKWLNKLNVRNMVNVLS